MGALRAARAATALVISVALAAGCASGSGKTTNTPSPTVAPKATGSPTAAVCTAAADLKTAVGGLASINVGRGALTSVQQTLTDINTKLNEFTTAAHGQFGQQTTQLRTAVSNLQTAVTAASASPNISTIASVATRVGDVISAYNSLKLAITTACG